MENKNPIRTLGDYSRPSHEGHQNTIELPNGNNLVPLRFDTIRLVQNGCSFHGLQSKDLNQNLKDFLKLMDSLDLDGESLSEAWTHFKDLLQKVPHHGIDLWLHIQIFYDHVNPTIRRTIDQSTGGKLRDKSVEESWALLENLALYDNEIQHLMEAHLAPNLPDQVNKITSSCEICSGPHDAQYCMENPEQAFVDYVSSCSNEVGGEQNRSYSSPKRIYFINTITVIRKEDGCRKAGTKESDTTGVESRDIKRNDSDDRACGETKEIEEVEKETKESGEEIEEETKRKRRMSYSHH
ncbi:hypothetical protein Tco_0392359 [Tanacetum coccineum]